MSRALCGLGVMIGMPGKLQGVCGIASPGKHCLDSRMAVFREIHCWIDPLARDGARAMAVDEWLCGVAKVPVLRVYRWDGDWASVGYFGGLAAAMARIDCPNWVRRMTGGGVVDHRVDWTYSLVVPADDPLAKLRGDASYRMIHDAVARVLRGEGVACGLSSGAEVGGEALCFANPVDHDVTGPGGEKLAGAGQRRSREALLHQGSVALPLDGEASRSRGRALADVLADRVEEVDLKPDDATVEHLVQVRYADEGWLQRR